MNLEETASAIRTRMGQKAVVTSRHGARSVVEILVMDEEGFTYHLLEEDQDPSIAHWWPFDEISAVESAEE